MIWPRARIRATAWELCTRRGLRLPPSRWEVRARAIDTTGLKSAPFSVANKTLVRFRVR